jgi:alpha-tubulin suppressor-like RCC1 family protein
MGAALDEEGRIWLWGENRKGELGFVDLSSRTSPYPLSLLGGKVVSAISIGANFAIAIGMETYVKDIDEEDSVREGESLYTNPHQHTKPYLGESANESDYFRTKTVEEE